MSADIKQALTTSSRHNPLYYICLFMNDYSYMTVTVSLREKIMQGLRAIEKFTKNKDFRAQIRPYWDVSAPTPSRIFHAFFINVNTVFSRFLCPLWTQIIYPIGYTPPPSFCSAETRFVTLPEFFDSFWYHIPYIFFVIKKVCVRLGVGVNFLGYFFEWSWDSFFIERKPICYKWSFSLFFYIFITYIQYIVEIEKY